MSHTATALLKSGPTQVMTEDAYCMSLGAMSTQYYSNSRQHFVVVTPSACPLGSRLVMSPRSQSALSMTSTHHTTTL